MTYFNSKPNLRITENPMEENHYKQRCNYIKLKNLNQIQCKGPNNDNINLNLTNESNKKFQEKLKTFNNSQVIIHKKVEFLQKIPIFSSFNTLDLQTIALSLQKFKYSKDQYVYRLGDPVKSVYFVKSGEFQMCRYKILRTLQLIPQASGMLQKLSQSKNIIKRKDLAFSIKSQYELIGHDEAIQGVKKREFSVYCTSRIGTLFVLPYTEFLSYISSPETSIIIQNKKDYFSLRKLELLKSEKVIDDIFTSKYCKKANCKDNEIKKKLKCFSVNFNQIGNFNGLAKKIQNSKGCKKLMSSALLSPRNLASQIVSEDNSPKLINRSLKSSNKILASKNLASFREKNTLNNWKPTLVYHRRHISQ